MATSKSPGEIRFDFDGRLFRVAARDLFTAPVECLVNAANSQLVHGGGVAGLFSRKAGEALDRESREIVKARGPLKVSEAVSTTAGNLPYRAVIHVVGPHASEEKPLVKLTMAVRNALVLAEKKGHASIAFPAVSTGIFGVDKETCARAFLGAVSRFFSERPESCVKEVWLCLMPADFPVFSAFYSTR